MITRPGFPSAYPVRGAPSGPSPVVTPGQPPAYWTTVPPGQWEGRSGKASWNPQAGPAYSLIRWAPAQFSLGTPHLAMDPTDPSTWQRSYVFPQ